MGSAKSDVEIERTPLLVNVPVPSSTADSSVGVDEEAAPLSASSIPSEDGTHASVSVLQIVLVLLIGIQNQ